MNILDLGTPFGLAFASGLNAYLPMLALALSSRWLHLYSLSPRFAFITHNWFIAALVILTILDFVADKIPLVDHLWNGVHSFIRPVAGAFVAVAASNGSLPASAFTGSHASSEMAIVSFGVIPWAGVGLLAFFIIGGALATFSHKVKSGTRLVSTLTTAGMLNPGLSVVEEVLAVIVILLSLFASFIMLFLLALFVLAFARRYWFISRI